MIENGVELVVQNEYLKEVVKCASFVQLPEFASILSSILWKSAMTGK